MSDNKIYENWHVYHPNGKLMFLCNEKRAKWYLNRGIAFQFSSVSIQLLFQPKSDGDPLHLLGGRENKCVVCGTEENLTKHHVVPSQYRTHLPLKYKDRNFVDILPMCRKCHDDYEYIADEIKEEWENRWGKDVKKWNILLYKAQSYYKTYLKHKDVLPPDRLIALENQINEYIEYLGINIDDILNTERKEIGKIIVDKWSPECLIKFWKNHFTDVVKPKYLPKDWDPNFIKIKG